MKTSQLEEWLSTHENFDEELIKKNGCLKLNSMIIGYMDKKGITRAELIRRMNLDRSYGYQLLNGTRSPTRNHLIQMGLLLELKLEELQRLLKTANKKPLYVRDLFDARVFFAVKHKMDYDKAMAFIWNG